MFEIEVRKNSGLSATQACYFKTDQPDSYVLFWKKVLDYTANFSTLLEIQNLGGKRWIHQTQHNSLTHFKEPTLKTIERIDFSPFFPFEDIIM